VLAVQAVVVMVSLGLRVPLILSPHLAVVMVLAVLVWVERVAPVGVQAAVQETQAVQEMLVVTPLLKDTLVLLAMLELVTQRVAVVEQALLDQEQLVVQA